MTLGGAAPSILSSLVRVPSTSSTLLYGIIIALCYICLCIVKRTKINKKRPMCLIFFYKNTILKKIFCIENRQRGDAKPDRASEFFVLPLYLIRRRPHVLHPVRRLQRVLTLRGQDLADGCKQVSKVRRLDLKYLRIGFLFKHYSH